MISTSESLDPLKPVPERAAESYCVAVRRGGWKLEAELQSQTKVNSIRPFVAASLRGVERSLRKRLCTHPLTGNVRCRATTGDWCENVVKGSYESGETCRIQLTGASPVPAGVRAAIVVMKPGNSGGAKGGRKVNASSEGSHEG